jgi:hypothetical protein
MSGDESGRGRYDEVVEFGSRPTGRPWWSRGLLACLVLAAVITVAVQAGSHQARPAAKVPRPPPPVRVTAVGHRLLGVTAGWQLFARGPDDLLQIQLAMGRITRTYVPPLETANPEVAFVIGDRDTIIRSSDYVPGYVVPEGRQAQALTGPLAGGGPLVPGPAGTQTAWVTTGPPTSPALSLVTLTGHPSGASIRFPAGGPQLPATAVSDGRGDVLVTSGIFTVYDAGPGWDRPVPGAIAAVGPADWLVVSCDPQSRHCRNEVIDTADGSRRALPGSAAAAPYYYSWPPTGVIAPDSSTAAVTEPEHDGKLTVHLINLHTGTTTDLPIGADANSQSMAWSPDSRWLFVAAADGKLVAISARTGKARSLGVTLPAVDQVAIRV